MCELTLEAAGIRPAQAALIPRVHELIWKDQFGYIAKTKVHAYSMDDAKGYFERNYGRHGCKLIFLVQKEY
jgi:hypothetical protein